MRKPLGWLLFVLGVPGLTWWANEHQAETIENKVTESANSELANIADFDKIVRGQALNVQGRDIHVQGHVVEGTSDEAKRLIKESLSDATGRRVVDVDLTAHPSFGPKFTANYSLGSGLSMEGFSTPDVNADGIANLLGFDATAGGVETTAYGEFGAAGSKLESLAPVLASDIDSAVIKVDQDYVSIDAQVSDVVDKDALTGKIKSFLGPNDDVKITDLQADDGEVRTNIQSGEREVFSSGYWLPSSDMDVSVANCQTETDRILSEYKIQFVTGSAALDAQSREGINRVAGLLIACLNGGKLSLEIAGHTDDVGDPEANLKLSEARAASVLAAIKSRGIESPDLTSKGYGDTRPIADNTTAEGRTKNRRTEINWSSK